MVSEPRGRGAMRPDTTKMHYEHFAYDVIAASLMLALCFVVVEFSTSFFKASDEALASVVAAKDGGDVAADDDEYGYDYDDRGYYRYGYADDDDDEYGYGDDSDDDEDYYGSDSYGYGADDDGDYYAYDSSDDDDGDYYYRYRDSRINDWIARQGSSPT